MPEISRFYGIVIRMYFNDHEPSHFHAFYSGDEAQIGINPVAVLSGRLPARAMALVVEWAVLHQAELMDNWQRLHEDLPAQPVPPLP